jgi:hypothetical protein
VVLATRDIAVYGSIIATLNGVWTLYHGIVRDRPRVGLSVAEGETLYAGVMAGDPALMIRVWNRGRRDFSIDQISRQLSLLRGTRMWVREIAQAVEAGPSKFGDGDGHTYIFGPAGYSRSKFPPSRWFVVDGAGRIYPLRERYRQRAEAAVLWPVRRFLGWRERRSSR